jgi:hypothetical protein
MDETPRAQSYLSTGTLQGALSKSVFFEYER